MEFLRALGATEGTLGRIDLSVEHGPPADAWDRGATRARRRKDGADRP